jgi:hypothetical protein
MESHIVKGILDNGVQRGDGQAKPPCEQQSVHKLSYKDLEYKRLSRSSGEKINDGREQIYINSPGRQLTDVNFVTNHNRINSLLSRRKLLSGIPKMPRNGGETG